ncbi:hypothetical protein FQR65_LT09364 [Abscondita terminalis]|nr:hypothetical protein FQR65_LT09364 [Abscondita terminalis]
MIEQDPASLEASSENEEFQEESNSDSDEQSLNEWNKRKLDIEHETTTNNSKKLKSDKSSLYKQPTAEEISRLRETEQLFNSNLFRLQIEQLLDEIKIKDKYKKLFNDWYENFQNVIESLPEFKFKISELNGKIKNKLLKELINVHKSMIKTDQDVNVILKKPDECVFFGPHLLNLSIRPKYVVNLGVRIPKQCLLPGDYLNNRFHIKSNYYATYLYVNLMKSKICTDIALENSSLLIIPNISDKILLKIHVVPPDNIFKLSKFEPNKNNVRENYFGDLYECNEVLLKETGTPFYNSRFLHDLTLIANYKSTEETLKGLKNVQDGIKLLTVWLQQRGLYGDDFGFSETLLINSIVYLIKKRKINKHMSSYQVVRNFWVFISTTNWGEIPISLSEDVKPDLLKIYQEYFDVVFLDKSGCYNLASFMYYEMYMKLQSEATLAVKFVDNVTFDSFAGLFMNRMNAETQYDALLILNDSEGFKNVYSLVGDNERCNYIGFYERILVKTILNFLRRGLSKRISHIVPISCENMGTKISLGITLDPNNAFSLIEKGPEANTKEASEFKAFWGKLSECRRFVDGAICEAVYFPANTVQEKRRIFQTVINYVVSKKLNVQKHYVVADQFEHMVVLQNVINPFPTGTCEEGSLNVITVFDELSKILRDSKLPLDVTAVQGGSEVFCYTALYPCIPTNHQWDKVQMACTNENIVFKEPFADDVCPKYLEAIECIIHLGINSKWPQNLQALRYIQLGFYLELSKYLKGKEIIAQVRRNCLEVFYKGLVFRFRLYNPKEIAALRKYTEPDGTVAYQDTIESSALEYKLNVLPKLIGALHGLQSQCPSFGPSSTIIKKWLRAQLIDEHHLPDIVIDLLNATLFINSSPYNCANLPQVAFLRFLKFVASGDWKLHQVVVNFNMELSKDDIDKFETSFQQMRHNYPALCIITPYDDGKSSFTKNCTLEVLQRLSVLAKSTYSVVEKGIAAQDLSVVKDLFIPNLEGYNVLIHLKELQNTRTYQRNSSSNKKILIERRSYSRNSKIPIVNFSPVDSYLKELRHHYGSFAMFFHDTYGGNVIAVLWKPNMLEDKPFKASRTDYS